MQISLGTGWDGCERTGCEPVRGGVEEWTVWTLAFR